MSRGPLRRSPLGVWLAGIACGLAGLLVLSAHAWAALPASEAAVTPAVTPAPTLMPGMAGLVPTPQPSAASPAQPDTRPAAANTAPAAAPVEPAQPAPHFTLPVVRSRQYLPMALHAIPLSRRLGFDVNGSVISYAELPSLKAGWYQNWDTLTVASRPNGMEFVQTWDTIAANVRANPGALWLIGNEMDRRDWCESGTGTGSNWRCTATGHQSEMLPEVYARAYHDLYAFIKRVDPTARLGIGGIIQPTPLRLAYLTRMWDSYYLTYGTIMPVDVWNIHNFILKEDLYSWGASIPPGITAQTGVLYPDDDTHHMDLTIFDSQIRAFRQWMKVRGQQNKPLIISEYGVLLSHTPDLQNAQLVQTYMLNTFYYSLYAADCSLGKLDDGCRVVQAWAWYSVDDQWFNPLGRLFDVTTRQITDTGRRYRDFSLAHLNELNR